MAPFEGDARHGFEIALEAAPSAMMLIDSRGLVAVANNAASELLGYPPGELVGRSVDTLVPRDRRGGHSAHRARFMADPGRRMMGSGRDFFAVRADQGLIPVEVALNPFERGGEMWVVCSLVDISERKALEAQRAAAQERVLRTQKAEGLGLLAGGVAHDFNNLLVSILGNASFARTLVRDDLVGECLSDIEKAAEQATELAKQMLSYSGKGSFAIESTDVDEFVHDTWPLLRALVPRRINLVERMKGGLPRVDVDRGQIRQVLINLVSNAYQAVGERSGAISIASHTLSVTSSWSAGALFPTEGLSPGEYVAIEVSDNGVGMDAATLQRMCDPFFTTREDGHGLGMAAVLGIVKGHGGGLAAYSEPGRGTVIKLLLPQAGAPDPRRPEAVAAKREVHVVVADDEPGVRRLVRRVLESRGMTVIEASNGEEAVEAVRAHGEAIALAILDISMPKMNGPEALARIRAFRPDLPMVMSSGFNEEDTLADLTGRGATRFLQKPFTAKGLLETVSEVLGGEVSGAV